MAARVLNGAALALLGMLPVIVVAVLATAAAAFAQVLAGFGVLALAAAPFLFAGFVIGYLLPVKAALAVSQLVLFPVAFAGGLLLPLENFPGWLAELSQLLPTRGARDLMVAVFPGAAPSVLAMGVLVSWTVLLAALAWWAYQRDEGHRFR